MLDGITVLNKIPITETANWVVIFLLGLIILSVVCYVLLREKNKTKLGSLIVFVVTSVSILFLIFSPMQETGKYKYQVTIDDNVNLKEFNNKYVIIEQEGEIYTIQKKEN